MYTNKSWTNLDFVDYYAENQYDTSTNIHSQKATLLCEVFLNLFTWIKNPPDTKTVNLTEVIQTISESLWTPSKILPNFPYFVHIQLTPMLYWVCPSPMEHNENW